MTVPSLPRHGSKTVYTPEYALRLLTVLSLFSRGLEARRAYR